MKFNLPGGWYIRNLDTYNWALARTVTSAAGNVSEKIVAYNKTLAAAWRNAVEQLALRQETTKDLQKLIKDLQKLKDNPPSE